MKKGDVAVIVADHPAFEGDEHGVPLQTVVTIEEIFRMDGKDVALCTFYNNGQFLNRFYRDELEVVGIA